MLLYKFFQRLEKYEKYIYFNFQLVYYCYLIVDR